MRSWTVGIFLIVVLLVADGCRDRSTEYRPTATVRDIMISMVDPSADTLWESVATIISPTGTEERAPRTDEEWATVRRSAVQLVEATNLLLMRDRRVAKPGDQPEDSQVELAPEQIERIINEDRAAWEKFARGLYDAALPAFRAIEAKNVQGLFDAGEKIDEACESCHQNYWYPPPTSGAWRK